MLLKRAHTLDLLIKLCSTKVKFKWTDIENNDFIAINKMVGRDILLSYPISCKRFIIHTYTIKGQLMEVMSQNGNPIAF